MRSASIFSWETRTLYTNCIHSVSPKLFCLFPAFVTSRAEKKGWKVPTDSTVKQYMANVLCEDRAAARYREEAKALEAKNGDGQKDRAGSKELEGQKDRAGSKEREEEENHMEISDSSDFEDF